MRNILVFCSLSALISFAVPAADVTLKWQEPEKFTDIRPANDSRKAFRERVQKKFEEFFTEMAAKLPQGYVWDVTITDIDLAGDVDYFAGGAGNALRVVKEIYSPAVRFNHSLRNANGEQVMQGEEKLRDMGFIQSLRSTRDSDEFRYEKQMLEDWFNKTVLPQVEQQQQALPKVSQG